MGVMYGGNVSLGYLNAISRGSLIKSKFIMLNRGDKPTKVPPDNCSVFVASSGPVREI